MDRAQVLPVCFLSFLALPALFGQAEKNTAVTPVERLDPVREESSPTAAQEGRRASETGSQRIVKSRDGWQVDLQIDSQVYYTTDLFYSDQAISEYDNVGIFSNRLRVGVSPAGFVRGGYAITPEVGVSWQRVSHFGDGSLDLGGFDFDQQKIFSEFRIRPVSRNLTILGGLEYNRLVDVEGSKTTYSAYVFYAGLQHYRYVMDNPLILSLDVRYHDAKRHNLIQGIDVFGKNVDTRWETSLSAYYLYHLGKLTAIPHVRIMHATYLDWQGSGRDDLVYALGLNLSYPLWRSFVLRGFFVFEKKDVAESFFGWPGYEKSDIGGGISANFSF
jgi:hypothetical protein